MKLRKQSRKGYYKTVFVESFKKVSAKDLTLMYDYGIDLISKQVKYPKVMLSLAEKTSKQTLLGYDEVYYVKIGLEIIGKLSISYQRFPSGIGNITYIYQEKGLNSDNVGRGKHERNNSRSRKSRRSSRTDKRSR